MLSRRPAGADPTGATLRLGAFFPGKKKGQENGELSEMCTSGREEQITVARRERKKRQSRRMGAARKREEREHGRRACPPSPRHGAAQEEVLPSCKAKRDIGSPD